MKNLSSASNIKSKSVLFCTAIFPPDIGGPATYVLRLATKMKNDGIKNCILTFTNDKIKKDDFGLNVIRIHRSFFIINYLKYFFKVLEIAPQYDVIYLQGTFSEGIPVVLANIMLKKKLIARVGGIFSWELFYNKRWTKQLAEEFLTSSWDFLSFFFRAIDRLVLGQCESVIANSHYIKKLLVLNKININKISVVYNFQDTSNFKKIDKNKLKASLGLTDKLVILSIGRLVAFKNFDKLIKFSKALDENYCILIAGDGPERKNLEMEIEKEALREKVKILGKKSQQQLQNLFQITDIFVLLSSWEGLSHVLIEAMDAKLLIVASNIEPNQEVLENYALKKLIPITEKSFVKAITEPSLPSFENKGRVDKFDFEINYQKTLEIICK